LIEKREKVNVFILKDYSNSLAFL